jgi:hypothetical protein
VHEAGKQRRVECKDTIAVLYKQVKAVTANVVFISYRADGACCILHRRYPALSAAGPHAVGTKLTAHSCRRTKAPRHVPSTSPPLSNEKKKKNTKKKNTQHNTPPFSTNHLVFHPLATFVYLFK